MKYISKLTILRLCAFAIISICTGLLHHFEVPDCYYFIGEQLSEIVLLYIIYTLLDDYTPKIIVQGLFMLSVGELFDEVLGNNIGFKINDYVLVIVAIFIVTKLIKRRSKEKSYGGGKK